MLLLILHGIACFIKSETIGIHRIGNSSNNLVLTKDLGSHQVMTNQRVHRHKLPNIASGSPCLHCRPVEPLIANQFPPDWHQSGEVKCQISAGCRHSQQFGMVTQSQRRNQQSCSSIQTDPEHPYTQT